MTYVVIISYCIQIGSQYMFKFVQEFHDVLRNTPGLIYITIMNKLNIILIESDIIEKYHIQQTFKRYNSFAYLDATILGQITVSKTCLCLYVKQHH